MSLDALQDLFARVRTGATGVWKLGQDPHRSIFLDKGQIVFAQSTHPLDRLTHLLVEKGKLTQAQMDYALENLAPGLSIGRNLIQMGFITQRDLLDVARFQVERVVWGALGSDGLSAGFEGRELDGSVVRLALDTPALLLGGLLNLRDRERMLEQLGPLEQVLELRVQPPESCLPPDLARLPAAFDGRRSLLDIARQSCSEPMRVGALALFLKELDWARSLPTTAPIAAEESTPAPAESPVLVVVAPGISVTQPVPAQPLAPDLSEAGTPARRPSLIEHIQAAQLPTANLDHLAAQLDGLAEPETALPLLAPEPATTPSPLLTISRDDDEITAENPVPPTLPEWHEAAGWHVEEGQAELPGPAVQEPVAPEPVVILQPLVREPEPFPLLPAPETPETTLPPEIPDFEAQPRNSKGIWFLGLGLAVLAAGSFVWWRSGTTSRPPAASPVAPAPASTPTPPATSAPPARQEPAEKAVPEALPPPKAPESATAPPAKAEPAAAGPEARWSALRSGRLDQALVQGRAHAKSLGASRWILRLEIACQQETLQNAASWMEARNKDLFILPMTLKNGQSCHQLFMGSYASKAEAEGEIAKLPPPFREGGNKPRAFQVSDIPTRQ
ncbi:MAG: hypothetical protein IPL96_05845 [Holophagaceae bacterium]|nr:hypothetical protein [Holophagaceae bacterium]